MASNTPNLNLLKKDPATDGNDTFNIKTMLNDNWDKIDSAMGDIPDQVADLAKTAVTYKEWPAGVNSINGLVDIGVYYVPDLSKYTNIPNHPAGGTNAAWAGANAIINVYNVQPPYVGPAALRVVELYITLGTAQYFYRRNTKLSTSGSQTTITHGSWERVITTATGRLQLDDVSGSIPLAIGAGSARTRWGFHVDAGGSMHIAPSTATGGTDSFNFDKGIAINAATGMVTVETSLRVNNGRLNVYNNRNSVAQYEPSGEWAGRIINFADASNEHGLVVGNRWGANESTVFLAGASGIGSSFKEFFRISGIGKIYMRDTSDQTIDLAATLADLKQSGVDRKNQLVSAINANGGSASAGEDISVLVSKLANIARTRYKTGITTGGTDGFGLRPIVTPAGFYTRQTVRSGFSDSSRTGLFSCYISSSGGSITVRATDTWGHFTDIFSYNIAGRSVTFLQFLAEMNRAGVATNNSNDNVGRESWGEYGGFDISGGVTFSFITSGNVSWSYNITGGYSVTGG